MAASADRFDEVCLPHLDTVYRVARRLARDNAEAEDLVQETFLRAFKGFDRFELRDHGAKPWLLRILHNTFYSRRDRDRRQPMLLDDAGFDRFAAEPERPEVVDRVDAIPWDEIDDEIKNAVEALQPEYRVVLLLWSFEGMSYKEIADVCDCPTGTVMSRLYRARQALLDSLAGYAQRKNVSKKA